MYAQGGGFNRSPHSGYFLGKCRSDLNNQSASPAERRKQKAKMQLTKPVIVEERPQILPNEVWEAQNRNMPYKVVLSVQKAPEPAVKTKKELTKNQIQRGNLQFISEKSLSPRADQS